MLLVAGRQASFFFLSCCYSVLNCSVTMPVSSVEPARPVLHLPNDAQGPHLECREVCLADVRCQSYNVAMFTVICKLNNQTKEARPEDFVKNKDRYYMAKGPKRGDRKCKD